MTKCCLPWFVTLAFVSASLIGARGYAGPAAREIPLDGEVVRIQVHPERVTALYFPEPVVHVVNSSPEDYRVALGKDRVVLRPLRPSAAGANLVIRTEHHAVGVVIEPARTSAEATSHVIFTARDEAPRAPGRLSMQLHGVFGRALAGDPAAAGQTDHTLLAGAAAHLSYRGSAYHAYEATLTVAQGSAMRFDGHMHDGYVGQMSRNIVLGRLQLGASMRYGQRFVPYVRGAAGLLGRALVAARVRTYDERIVLDGPANEFLWDMAVSGGAGIELHVGDTWQAGAGLLGTRAVTAGPHFESLEGAVYVRW
jgi:hypothetical protein